MNYLKLPQKPAYKIQKTYFSVGTGASYDACVPGDVQKVLYTLHTDKDRCFLIPGSERIWINGKAISKAHQLSPCDRIEWKNGIASFLDDYSEDAGAKRHATHALEILKKLTPKIEEELPVQSALQEVLTAIVGAAGAEIGYLVSEITAKAEWKLLATVGAHASSNSSRQREIISSTILNEAVSTREPVYVESIVGHPLAEQASIMDAQVFSLACLPLVAGPRVFGCVYLYTRTPGRSIDSESLSEINILATQMMLLLVSRAELNRSRNENKRLQGLFGKSVSQLLYAPGSPMEKVDSRITKLAPSDLSIIIRGETGTGKEVVARELHRRSARPQGPFVAVNCGAIPPTLIESTLFGFVKGAFTGADRDRSGKFEQANGGTLFLDEIGDLPLDLQVRLLRVLQERVVEPVGSDKSIKVDCRVIAATHQDLEAAVAKSQFREDLLYRLNGASLSLPKLSERKMDLPILTEHFLKSTGSDLQLSEAAKEKLNVHHWPGNVRELQQAVTRAAALSEGTQIESDDLELSASFRDQGIGFNLDEGSWDNLKDAQVAFTQEFVKRALTKTGGNRGEAAKTLGISERTLYRILSNDTADSLV